MEGVVFRMGRAFPLKFVFRMGRGLTWYEGGLSLDWGGALP